MSGRPMAVFLGRFIDLADGSGCDVCCGEEVGEAEDIRTSERRSSSSAFRLRVDAAGVTGDEKGTMGIAVSRLERARGR